uniref:Uncharacterized protein n=1 Tax=Romanomermis culicivorax TaxID=13658 RepID=A0A915KBJ4_ROMCU
MDWVRSLQDRSNLRACLPQEFVKGLQKGLKQGETLGKTKRPPVWTGSSAYMQQQYADAKAMARELDINERHVLGKCLGYVY